MSKVTSMTWKGVKLNIVDTPGHADFGGVWPSQVHSMPQLIPILTRCS